MAACSNIMTSSETCLPAGDSVFESPGKVDQSMLANRDPVVAGAVSRTGMRSNFPVSLIGTL